MAISIAQAQQALLGSGALDTLGQQRDEVGVALAATDAAIIRAAAKFVQDVEANLRQSDRISSGSLLDSVQPVVKEWGNGVNIIEIMVNDYYKFVDAGVKGLKRGRSTKGYQFRTPYGSKRMVDNLEREILEGRAKIINTKVAVTTREKKRKGTPDTPSRAAAKRWAFFIKRKGLEPSNFWTDAVRELERDIATGVASALRIDVIENVT